MDVVVDAFKVLWNVSVGVKEMCWSVEDADEQLTARSFSPFRSRTTPYDDVTAHRYAAFLAPDAKPGAVFKLSAGSRVG